MKKNGRGETLELGDSVRDSFEGVLKHLADQNCMFGWPNSRNLHVESDEDRDQSEEIQSDPVVPALTVHEPSWITESMLHVLVTMGEQGGHSLYHRPGEDVATDIKEGAAQAEYRVDFLFPSAGDTGVVVFEVVSSSDPTRLLRRHLIAAARQIKEKRTQDYLEERQVRKAAGETLGKPVRQGAPIPSFRRLADSARVREIITNAKSSTVRFDQYEPSSRGGEGEIRKRQLSVRLTDDLEFDKAVGTVMKWLRIISEDYDTRLPAANSTIMSASDTDISGDMSDPFAEAWEEFAGDDFGDPQGFNKVSIEVTPDKGSSKTFTPGLVSEFFTYPMGQGRPTHAFYYQNVCGKVSQLSGERPLPVVVPRYTEVVACLPD